MTRLALLAALLLACRTPPRAPSSSRFAQPRLVVLIVIDQLPSWAVRARSLGMFAAASSGCCAKARTWRAASFHTRTRSPRRATRRSARVRYRAVHGIVGNHLVSARPGARSGRGVRPGGSDPAGRRPRQPLPAAVGATRLRAARCASTGIADVLRSATRTVRARSRSRSSRARRASSRADSPSSRSGSSAAAGGMTTQPRVRDRRYRSGSSSSRRRSHRAATSVRPWSPLDAVYARPAQRRSPTTRRARVGSTAWASRSRTSVHDFEELVAHAVRRRDRARRRDRRARRDAARQGRRSGSARDQPQRARLRRTQVGTRLVGGARSDDASRRQPRGSCSSRSTARSARTAGPWC